MIINTFIQSTTPFFIIKLRIAPVFTLTLRLSNATTLRVADPAPVRGRNLIQGGSIQDQLVG